MNGLFKDNQQEENNNCEDSNSYTNKFYGEYVG